MASLRQRLRENPDLDQKMLHGARGSLPVRALAYGRNLGEAPQSLSGRSVLLLTSDQVAAVQAMIELDGVARRLILCPPDLAEADLLTVMEDGEVDILVTDRAQIPAALSQLPCVMIVEPSLADPKDDAPAEAMLTEWAMFTSGTTGPPKMVAHDLPGLTGAIKPAATSDPVVWATFYDIRRYGGLQALLRGLLSNGSMAVSSTDESQMDFVRRLGQVGVTHLTGTPSHWRKALANAAPELIAPSYVRMSGEIADQSILDQLRQAFPAAAMGHAFASTEAGVGFEVTDGLEGFPAQLIDQPIGEVEMKVVDDSLRIRSGRTARRYIGGRGGVLADAEGYVDTGDVVQLRDGRYYFAGRRGGIINVGGLKVHPEEIEGVVNSYPGVRLSRAIGRRNPFTGQIVIVEVVLNNGLTGDRSKADAAAIQADIIRYCEERLAPFKVPAMVRLVAALKMTPGGKLLRDPS